jgi:predicted PurR-regulated permease PerM
MKARDWLERGGGIVRGIVIAAVIAGVLAYVVEWLRLHRDTEPPPWTWVVVVAVGGVLLLVRIVDAVVTSVRQALTDTPRAHVGDRPGAGARDGRGTTGRA